MRHRVIGQRDPARAFVAPHFRRAQIIGQSRADGLLQTRFHDQQIKQLMPRLCFALHQPRQGGNLGTQSAGLPFGLGPRGGLLDCGFGIRQHPLRRLMPRSQTGGVFGGLRQHAFAIR